MQLVLSKQVHYNGCKDTQDTTIGPDHFRFVFYLYNFTWQEEMEKKIRQRLMMQQSHREQMAFKEMRKEAEKAEEAAFRETMLAKFAEDDRIEQMNAHKRRMKQLEHRRAVEKLIEERKQQRRADMVTTRSRVVKKNSLAKMRVGKLRICSYFNANY